MRHVASCKHDGKMTLVKRRRANNGISGCRGRVRSNFGFCRGCNIRRMGANCINSLLSKGRCRDDRFNMLRCHGMVRTTTHRHVYVSGRRPIVPANLRHAFPGLVARRKMHKRR